MRTRAALVVLLALAPAAARAEAKISAAAEAQLDEGLRRLYGLDYAGSRAAFRKIIELEPDSPWGYLFEAGGIWWQSSEEYGLFQSTPTLQGLFEQDVEAALRKADVYQDSKDRDQKAAGYFVSGMALGTRGQWSLMKGHYVAAYFDGKKAVKHLKKCVKLDPTFEDAYLGLGIYDYQAAHLSGVAKLGALLGVRGDEKRGLDHIRQAMDQAHYARRQAAQFLSSIYIVDKHDWATALPVLQRLRRDFPDSPYFLMLEAVARHRTGDWDGSLALGRELHRLVEADPAAFHPKWLSLICGLAGADCLQRADLELLLGWLDRALAAEAAAPPAPTKPAPRRKGAKPAAATPPPPSTFETQLRLYRGMTLDALGRRAEAEDELERVRRRPDFDGSQELAAACLEQPCSREAILKRLRAMSQD